MTAGQRAELDGLLREALMTRVGAVHFTDDGADEWLGACERCQRVRFLNTSHIEPKGRVPRLRWVLDNVLAMCSECHPEWWHANPAAAEAFVTAHLGQTARDRLTELARPTGARPDYAATKLALLSAGYHAREAGAVRMVR